MISPSLSLHLSTPVFGGFPVSTKSNFRNALPLYKFSLSASFSSSSNPSSSSSWEREEIRWLREEQRWLREEQRWIREESRWNAERESLLREIAFLKLRIEALELEKSPPPSSISDALSNLASTVQALKESDAKSAVSQIAESSSGPRPIMLEEKELKSMVVEEVRVSENVAEVDKVAEAKQKKATLRTGSEGQDVREMQKFTSDVHPTMTVAQYPLSIDCNWLIKREALLKLGFYSGEDEMEYSSFSTGTERAVKTWQASVGTHEDGIMTAELLERLFMELETVAANLKVSVDQKDSASVTDMVGVNSTPVASVSEVAEIQQTVVNERGIAEVEVSQHRVFLLGENRWEEPSRLASRDKPISRSKTGSATKCLTCHGEGRLLCTECDGTGEPNVEPQFLEWVDEGAACPYCEGLGYTICDVCEGKAITEA